MSTLYPAFSAHRVYMRSSISAQSAACVHSTSTGANIDQRFPLASYSLDSIVLTSSVSISARTAARSSSAASMPSPLLPRIHTRWEGRRAVDAVPSRGVTPLAHGTVDWSPAAHGQGRPRVRGRKLGLQVKHCSAMPSRSSTFSMVVRAALRSLMSAVTSGCTVHKPTACISPLCRAQ